MNNKELIDNVVEILRSRGVTAEWVEEWNDSLRNSFLGVASSPDLELGKLISYWSTLVGSSILVDAIREDTGKRDKCDS